jgi:hypothetical protein
MQYELVDPSRNRKSSAAAMLGGQGGTSKIQTAGKRKNKAMTAIVHEDIIQDGFWLKRPWILSRQVGPTIED